MNETAEAIEYARGILSRAAPASAGTLTEIIDRYDRLLAEDEPGIFSWHQALYEVAQQAKRAADNLADALACDPIPDLAWLLASAQRQAHSGELVPGVAVRAQKLADELGLPEFATAEEVEAAVREALAVRPADWTVNPETGRPNSSPLFRDLAAEVERLIRDDAFQLISGRADRTAGLIMAHLAHKHHLAPVQAGTETEPHPVSHVTPPCPECGEPARLYGGTAVLRHAEGCTVGEAARAEVAAAEEARS